MSQIRLPYVHIVHCSIEFNEEGIRRGKSRGKANVKPKLDSVIEESEIKRLVKEGCRRDITLEARLKIRSQLKQLRKQIKAERSRLA